MRLGGSRRSTNVEDYRGQPSGRPGMKFGLGTIVVLVVGYFLGINPLTMLGLMGDMGGTQNAPAVAPGTPGDTAGNQIAAMLGATEDVWTEIFRERGAQYPVPTLALFSGGHASGCGFAQSAMGPFYCPSDQKVYIDLAFFNELAGNLQAPGDFAQAYVLAHEVGHHVQNVLGTLGKVQSAQQSMGEVQRNQMQVRVELQADCYAGIWAHYADQQQQILEPGDIEEGLRAAAAVGDDTLQRRAQGQVVPESFTHGSSEQRMSWFQRGYRDGRLESCDTFAGS